MHLSLEPPALQHNYQLIVDLILEGADPLGVGSGVAPCLGRGGNVMTFDSIISSG